MSDINLPVYFVIACIALFFLLCVLHVMCLIYINFSKTKDTATYKVCEIFAGLWTPLSKDPGVQAFEALLTASFPGAKTALSLAGALDDAASKALSAGQEQQEVPPANPAAGQAGHTRLGLLITLVISSLVLAACAMLNDPASPEGQQEAQEIKQWASWMTADAQAMSEVEHGACLALQAIPDVGAYCAILTGAIPIVQAAAGDVAGVLSKAADAAQAKAALAQAQARVSPALAQLPPVPPELQQYLDAQPQTMAQAQAGGM